LAINRSNYFVLLGAEAVKIEFAAGRGPARATGVTFVYGGNTYTAHATKEVVLSTGKILPEIESLPSHLFLQEPSKHHSCWNSPESVTRHD
jgi:hypothetical protein